MRLWKPISGMGGTSQWWWHFTSLLALLWFILQNNQFVSDRHIFPGYSLENIDSGNVKCIMLQTRCLDRVSPWFLFIMENTNLLCLYLLKVALVFFLSLILATLGFTGLAFGTEAHQASSHPWMSALACHSALRCSLPRSPSEVLLCVTLRWFFVPSFSQMVLDHPIANGSLFHNSFVLYSHILESHNLWV